MKSRVAVVTRETGDRVAYCASAFPDKVDDVYVGGTLG
jgi:hypothetical protein